MMKRLFALAVLGAVALAMPPASPPTAIEILDAEVPLNDDASTSGQVNATSYNQYSVQYQASAYTEVQIRVTIHQGAGDIILYAGIGGSTAVIPGLSSTWDYSAYTFGGDSVLIIRNTDPSWQPSR